MNGKEICKILRQIRQQVADDNGIPYSTEECKHKGDCLGTCPKCDSEVNYLSEEIRRRGLNISKIIAATGLTLALTSCDTTNIPNNQQIGRTPDNSREQLRGAVARVIPANTTDGQTPGSSRTPNIVCHYTNYGSMEGDVPYEPNPTSRVIAEQLEKLIVYPDTMLQSGIEAKVLLTFTYNKKGIAQKIEVKDSPDPLFTTAVTNALKQLDKVYKDEVEFDEQEYYIPIEFTLTAE